MPPPMHALWAVVPHYIVARLCPGSNASTGLVSLKHQCTTLNLTPALTLTPLEGQGRQGGKLYTLPLHLGRRGDGP